MLGFKKKPRVIKKRKKDIRGKGRERERGLVTDLPLWRTLTGTAVKELLLSYF